MKSVRPATTFLRNATALQPRPCRRTPARISSNTAPPAIGNKAPSTSSSPKRAYATSLFGSSPSTVSASRTIHHPARLIFDIISDISSYQTYIPYCQRSLVTRSSRPAPDGRSYPEEAQLTIGFNDSVREEFWSRVYCVPDNTIETVCGRTETTLAPGAIRHHNPRPAAADDPTRDESTLSHLLTRWTLRACPDKLAPERALRAEGGAARRDVDETGEQSAREKTEVNLVIEYQFANPMYAALSSAAAPVVADKMIEAFETRVRMVVEGPGHAGGKE